MIPAEPEIDYEASLIGYLQISDDVSAGYHRRQARRLVQVRSGVVEALEHLAAPSRGIVLRQEARNELSDEDWILERLHEIEQERSELHAHLRSMGSVYAPKLRDVDDLAAQEDTDRLNAERRDERAAEQAPRVRAS